MISTLPRSDSDDGSDANLSEHLDSELEDDPEHPDTLDADSLDGSAAPENSSRQHKPRILKKLTPALLLDDPDGIDALACASLTLAGSDEFSAMMQKPNNQLPVLQEVINVYQTWARKFYPRLCFMDLMGRIEKLCTSKLLRTHMDRMYSEYLDGTLNNNSKNVAVDSPEQFASLMNSHEILDLGFPQAMRFDSASLTTPTGTDAVNTSLHSTTADRSNRATENAGSAVALEFDARQSEQLTAPEHLTASHTSQTTNSSMSHLNLNLSEEQVLAMEASRKRAKERLEQRLKGIM